MPEAEIEGILIQDMIDDGVELLAGAKKKTPFGQAIVIGLGGIFTEVLDDTAMRLAPVSNLETQELLEELHSQGYDVLKGARGGTEVDMSGLVKFITRFSDVVAVNEHIEEIDLNR